MDFELHPAIPLAPRISHILISAAPMLVEALNGHSNLHIFQLLHCLQKTARAFSAARTTGLPWKCAQTFTVFQLLTMREANHHMHLIREHDLLLCEDARETMEHISRAMNEAANNAIVLRYSSAVDPFLEGMMNHAENQADRIF